ncbi:MAG TPA: adenine deaminase [Sphaerochaeta sp.]|nr:MAG: hypothetical protein A2Y31_07580 [Spirochaetes bacterium GWC2_52_13]OHD65799.1 MAG: hypothetical protein A2101_00010 [Spirochaetes bacterium GWF2_52_7]HCG63643.1 adenine deaminase [Sphaerochaeta sp.]HCJ94299.1 adenine deaminase [Sphaerochaeta sp.]
MHVDTLITDARIYNPYIKKWQVADIALLNGKIFHVGDCVSQGLTATETIACHGAPVIPGLIDIHLHIESSLCTPYTFAQAVLPHGITTVVAEHHEMANIFGRAGIEVMVAASKHAPIDIFHGIPSSVPSTNTKLETTGGTIDASDLPALVGPEHPKVICLGEVMNFSTLLERFEELVGNPSAVDSAGMIDYLRTHHPLMPIEGHCPSIKGLDLSKLLYLGVDSDHCKQDIEGMRQRFTNGMFVEIQGKSVDVEIISYLQEHDVEGLWAFVTDDVPPDLLIRQGHLDQVVRQALQCGLSLEKAIVASSFAPAQRMGFRDRGAIAPGKIADLLILADDSSEFKIREVFKRGKRAQECLAVARPYAFPERFKHSITLVRTTDLSPIFTVAVPKDTVQALVMHKLEDSTYTEAVHRTFEQIEGVAIWEQEGQRVNLVVVINRYTKKLTYAQGFCDGDVLTNGAYCSTYAHDHHNILVIGDNTADMRIALDWVLSREGGICTASKGTITATIPLPIGGILSEAPMVELGQDVIHIQDELHRLGMRHPNPLMSLSTITLPVSPAIKITDKGLIDVATASLVPLFSKAEGSNHRQ